MLLTDLTAADGSLTSDGCGLIRDSYSGTISGLLGLPLDTAGKNNATRKIPS